MAINSLHPEYELNIDQWRTFRDVMAGDRDIKRAGVRYVPRLEGQSESEYRAYVERGFIYNATARTVSGYLGIIFRREPVMKLPYESMGDFPDDCDLQGRRLDEYAREVVSEVTVLGRVGTLIDWESDCEDRAYLSLYRAEDILNWREERINGRMQLTLVVLRELVECSDGGDGYSAKPLVKFRVLRLAKGGSNSGYFYTVEMWSHEATEDGGERRLVLLESITPTRRGQALPNIRFVFHGPNISKARVEASPIADIVAANLDHYRMNVDYKHGMHYTALPTAWGSGHSWPMSQSKAIWHRR